jgi:NAD(P)-dependent dehydrogenase (short-subunit alcohol dehydrogenase family)
MTVPSPFGRKVAVVTGAGTGIGRASAMMLAARGYNVAALDHRGDQLMAVDGERIRPFVCDISIRAEVKATIAGIWLRWAVLTP